MATEDKFPTIRDLRDALSWLCDLGLGDMPTQVTVVPASTMIAVARMTGPKQLEGKTAPPLMIEFEEGSGRMAPTFVSCDYLSGQRTTLPPFVRQ